MSWLSRNVTTDVPGRELPALLRTKPAWFSHDISKSDPELLHISVNVFFNGKSNPSTSAPKEAMVLTQFLIRKSAPQYSPTIKGCTPFTKGRPSIQSATNCSWNPRTKSSLNPSNPTVLISHFPQSPKRVCTDVSKVLKSFPKNFVFVTISSVPYPPSQSLTSTGWKWLYVWFC